MKHIKLILPVSFLLILYSCVVQFIPETSEDQDLLVVEGLITDQPGPNIIKLSKSMPLGIKSDAKPLYGCTVSVSDNLGNYYSLTETIPGTYVTNPADFQGVAGRWYTLHINTNTGSNRFRYESYPVKMNSVPPIDSIYYKKLILNEAVWDTPVQEGCQIYLNTHDSSNQCKFYRWEYSETWEFKLPYHVPNKVCWVSNNSDVINIKNASVLKENRIERYPLNYISNASDRLSERYSILVNQYSLNEDEFFYWEKLQNISELTGGLYDMIPSAVPSNVYSLDNPGEKVLGYFSVSCSSSKRFFINEHFSGLYQYSDCISDTIHPGDSFPTSGSPWWVIISSEHPPYSCITFIKGCADCTVRGTLIEPDFWKEGK